MTEIEMGFYNPYLNPVKNQEYQPVSQFQVDTYCVEVKQRGSSTQYLLRDSCHSDKFVGYLTYNSYEIVTLYIWPEYRERGLARLLLSITPKGLAKWVQPFRKYKEEELIKVSDLNHLYQKYYQ